MRSAYNDIGGVTGGLTQWADRVFYGLENEAMRQRARRIFTDLVHLGNENQKPPDSRQSMPLAALCRHPHELEDIRQLVQRLADGKLLVTTYDLQSRQEIVEMIHDALLWGWGLMRQWLQSDRKFLTWHQEITRRTQAWVETNITRPARREKEKLLRGSELKEARSWHQHRLSEISQAEREFIQASWDVRQRRAITGLVGGTVLTLAAGEGLLQWLQPRLEPYTDILQFSRHKGPVYCVAWSPEATRLASGSADRAVWVYEAAGNAIYQYTGHHQTVTSLAWSPEGFRIASASADATVQVWYSDGLGNAHVYDHHSGPVQSVAWSSVSKSTLIASGGRDAKVYVWDVYDGKHITTYTGHTGPVNAVAWSPDGKLIASGSGQDPQTLRGDNSVHVWEATTGKRLNIYTGHKSHVRAVAWSPDQKYIASAGWDQTVQVWAFSSTQPLYTYLGHHGAPVNAVSWSPDGKLIASAGGDGTVQVWQALDGNLICSYEQHKRSVESVAWAPEVHEKRIASASDDTLVRLWQLK